jgi:hypothetical protein
MLECNGASILDLISEPSSGIPLSFLVSDGSWVLLVGHVKSNDGQISGAAGRGLLLPASFSINVGRAQHPSASAADGIDPDRIQSTSFRLP